jgi:hypothetical protein
VVPEPVALDSDPVVDAYKRDVAAELREAGRHL